MGDSGQEAGIESCLEKGTEAPPLTAIGHLLPACFHRGTAGELGHW